MGRKLKATAEAVPRKVKPKPVIRLDPVVSAKALELAAGDRSRIVIVGDGVAVVVNNARQRRAWLDGLN